MTPEQFTERVQAGTRMAEVAVTSVLADGYARALRSIAGDVARRFKRQATSLTAAFDPTQHPHRPGGDQRGGEWAPKPVTVYHGTGKGGRVLDIGLKEWDDLLFVTRDRAVAEHYADRHLDSEVRTLELVPGAKIVKTTLDPIDYTPERLVAEVRRARAEGADAIEFGGGIGIAVLNKDKALTAAGPREYADEQPEPKFILPNPQELVPKAALAAAIEKRTREIRAQVVAVTVGGILTEAGIEFDVGGIFARRILDDVGARLRDADLSTRDAIRTVIDRAQAEGWTVPETAGAIKAHITELADSTAIQLARTDLIGTSNASAIAAARIVFSGQQGIVKRWLATEDERTRPTHVDADGQVVPLGSGFTVGTSRLDYPGDPSGPDAEVCNCRCTLLFEEEGLLAAAWRGITAAFDPAKHPHEPGGSSKGGQWAAKVGVTPYRPDDDPKGFYDSGKYKTFTDSLGPTADKYDVTIDGQQKVSGFWQGDQEPSLALDVHDGEDGVRRFAEDLRSTWDQDAVLLFHPDDAGEDLAYRLDAEGDVAGALTEAGVDGATIYDGGVEIIGGKGDAAKVAQVAESLGVDPADVKVRAGRLSFVERPLH